MARSLYLAFCRVVRSSDVGSTRIDLERPEGLCVPTVFSRLDFLRHGDMVPLGSTFLLRYGAKMSDDIMNQLKTLLAILAILLLCGAAALLVAFPWLAKALVVWLAVEVGL